jgi:hypothetical protein
VTHVKGLAHVGVHICGPKALAQLAQTPAGATVFMVLGTYDAEGTIARLDKSIDDIVAAGRAQEHHVDLARAPCVRQSWDARARDLDQMLSARFENTDVRYVRMRDAELCAGNLQEPDGVHLKTKGYVHMWEKAAAAAGFAVEQTPRRIADPAARAAAAAALGCLGFCARARPARAATVGAARRRHYGLDPPRPTR